MKDSYLALLRGINVGGNKKVPMAELKELFEDDFNNVKTILNSGNVVFESSTKPTAAKVQKKIEEKFGFSVATQVFPLVEISTFLDKHPVKKDLKQFASFIKKQIIYNEIQDQTLDLMAKLDKEHGKEITTRTLKTLARILVR